MRRSQILILTARLLLCGQHAVAGATPDLDRLWDYEHPAQTEQKFRALLPSAQRVGGRSFHVQLLSQLARAQGLQGHRAEAHKTLDQAEALLRPGMKTARVRCLLERGRLYNDAKKPELARARFTQAWQSARSVKDDPLAIDAAHMLGIVETGNTALEWDRKALSVAEQSKNLRARGWLGPLYNNMGWTYYDRGEYPRALSLLEKARSFFEGRKKPGPIRIARYSVGKVLRALGRVDEALALQRNVQAEMEKANEPDGYVYEELGECLLAQKKPDEAQPFFAKAYELLSKDQELMASEPKRVQRLKELSGK